MMLRPSSPDQDTTSQVTIHLTRAEVFGEYVFVIAWALLPFSALVGTLLIESTITYTAAFLAALVVMSVYHVLQSLRGVNVAISVLPDVIIAQRLFGGTTLTHRVGSLSAIRCIVSGMHRTVVLEFADSLPIVVKSNIDDLAVSYFINRCQQSLQRRNGTSE